ncbi:matrix metalloproteinase-25-like [Tachypleus tridentatus]|uniref:matrix metalloproteinase-25-like n=1 Tax=Tachypleus tridentatus TaxID=6853 RepID=UPI003FD3FEC3
MAELYSRGGRGLAVRRMSGTFCIVADRYPTRHTSLFRTRKTYTVKVIWVSSVKWLVSLFVYLTLMLPVCETRLTNQRSSRLSLSEVEVMDFLDKFGYLPSSDFQTGNLRTDEQLRKAIKLMQKFGGINETGEMDEATVKLMNRKRCGMPDLIGPSDRVKRYALQGQKWETTHLTWSIKDWPRGLNPREVRGQLTKALKVWSDASKLTFTYTGTNDADIMVSFLSGYHGDGYPFDGLGHILAHAFFPGKGIQGDAHFDAEEKWVVGQPDEYSGDELNLFGVAAHEFGHSLGLSHSSVQGSLMFPYYQEIKDNFQLPYDDMIGIQQLYGAKLPKPWPTMPPITQPPPKIPPRKPVTPKKPVWQPPTQRPPHPSTPMQEEPKPTLPPKSAKPDACETSIDAISIIRNEIFIFKDKYFWRMNEKGSSQWAGYYPAEIDKFWFGGFKKVDAVYERTNDAKIMFFSGNKYWLFNANKPEAGYPRPLVDLGLPARLKKIDGAMVWGHNGKTYLFSGKQYWRYDETEGRVELDYPRHMSMWKGVPYNIDATFQYSDGKTYFFKDKYFQTFDDQKMKVKNVPAQRISEVWFGCPSTNERLPPPIWNPTNKIYDENFVISTLLKTNYLFWWLILLSLFVQFLLY